jgi:D-glycero-D-manno-heptose 1,7-bisphosphate phosphatase
MLHIDPSWALFLDRDGVINQENPEGYILSWADFKFMPGVPESIHLLRGCFGRIIVVSNQKCVGKGLLSAENLERIHFRMMNELAKAGGNIDQVYFCPDTGQESPCRKPNTGMGLRACGDFPDIKLPKSVVIGNNLSDMDFGKRLGMTTCFLTTTQPAPPLPHPWIDLVFESLPVAAGYFLTASGRPG